MTASRRRVDRPGVWRWLALAGRRARAAARGRRQRRGPTGAARRSARDRRPGARRRAGADRQPARAGRDPRDGAPGRDPHRRREARRQRRGARPAARPLHRLRERRDLRSTRASSWAGASARCRSPAAASTSWLEVPPDVAIEAKTFGGDVSASGLRAGAKLETTGGRIGVSDVRGGVVTHQLRGGQKVAAVEGDVDLDGVEGDMDLQGPGRRPRRRAHGRRQHPRRGHPRRLRAPGDHHRPDRLHRRDPPGGALRPAQLRGDVRFRADRRPGPVRAARPLGHAARASAVPLHGSRRDGEWLRRRVPRPPPPCPAPRTALVELSSTLGGVVIQSRSPDARR